MKSILLTAAGSPGSMGFIRSVRALDAKYHIIGVDGDPYRLQRSIADENYLVPYDDSEDYIDIIRDIVYRYNVDIVHIQSQYGLVKISEARDVLPCKTFLPSHNTITICQNKYICYDIWKHANIEIPQTILITDKESLYKAFLQLGSSIWLRPISGSMGKGSLATSKIDEAYNWVTFWNGWGTFTAAEYLQGLSTTWHSLWFEGQLVVGQERARLLWDSTTSSQTGLGVTSVALTRNDALVADVALQAILAIDPSPHGLFSVDLTYNGDDRPCVTEINIGRFISSIDFFTFCGLNMPELFLSCLIYNKRPIVPITINPLPKDAVWIRGMDAHPTLTHLSEITRVRDELDKRKIQVYRPIG